MRKSFVLVVCIFLFWNIVYSQSKSNIILPSKFGLLLESSQINSDFGNIYLRNKILAFNDFTLANNVLIPNKDLDLTAMPIAKKFYQNIFDKTEHAKRFDGDSVLVVLDVAVIDTKLSSGSIGNTPKRGKKYYKILTIQSERSGKLYFIVQEYVHDQLTGKYVKPSFALKACYEYHDYKQKRDEIEKLFSNHVYVAFINDSLYARNKELTQIKEEPNIVKPDTSHVFKLKTIYFQFKNFYIVLANKLCDVTIKYDKKQAYNYFYGKNNTTNVEIILASMDAYKESIEKQRQDSILLAKQRKQDSIAARKLQMADSIRLVAEENERDRITRRAISLFGPKYAAMILNHQVCIGMTEDMCEEAWGEPLRKRTIYNEDGKTNVWEYGYGKILYFKGNKLVQAVL